MAVAHIEHRGLWFFTWQGLASSSACISSPPA
jgi:hypothetical protein